MEERSAGLGMTEKKPEYPDIGLTFVKATENTIERISKNIKDAPYVERKIDLFSVSDFNLEDKKNGPGGMQ
jgi:hypothetical protein